MAEGPRRTMSVGSVVVLVTGRMSASAEAVIAEREEETRIEDGMIQGIDTDTHLSMVGAVAGAVQGMRTPDKTFARVAASSAGSVDT